MPTKRYFNWKLAAVLLIGLFVLGITAYGLRQWQRTRRANQGLILGTKAYNQQKWEEAVRYLGRYIAIARNDVEALLKYADAHLKIRPLKRSNVQQAIAAYRTILRIDKENHQAAKQLTEIYLDMGLPGEAELIARRQLEIHPDSELARLRAIALARQREFDQAKDQLIAIIQKFPADCPKAKTQQILAYEILAQINEQHPESFSKRPIDWLNEAIKSHPTSALAYIIRASFYLRNKDRTKALADLEKAQKQDLSDPTVRLRLAKQLISVNLLDEAEKQLAAVQAIEPSSQDLWQTWATLALKSRSKDMMLKVAQNGLKQLGWDLQATKDASGEPSFQSWDFIPRAAELFIHAGQYNLAADCIDQLRQKDTGPTTLFLEGLLADKKGLGYQAVKYWYQAIQGGANPAKIRLPLAMTLWRLGDRQSAIKQLRTLISEQPHLFSARLSLARLLTELGNWSQAAEQANIARQISPDNLDAALLYIQNQIQLLKETQNSKLAHEIKQQLDTLAKTADNAIEVQLLQVQLAAQNGDFANARLLLDQLKRKPNINNQTQVKITLAEVQLLIQEQKEDEAILQLNKAITQLPTSYELVRYLAILLASQDRHQECEDLIKDTLASIEENSDFAIYHQAGVLPDVQRKLCLILANLYEQWNQEEKAYKLLTWFAKNFPNDIPIKRRLLRCKQIIKNPQAAQMLVNEIKSLEGETGWQWRYEQAKLWFAQDNFSQQYPQIISILKENLLANPDDQASRMLLATTYERAGQTHLAISTYNEALARSPRDLHIIIPVIAALYRAGEYDRADQILHRATREKLFHPQLKKLQLQSYLKRGELNQACNILEDVLASQPDNRSVCLSLALLKMRQNRLAQAEELLNRLKISDPNSLPVMVAQIELKIRQNKSAEALRLCDEIINKFNNASAYILRARTLVSLGQVEKAEKDFEYATTIESDNAKAWIAKSDFYRSIGQIEKATSSIQKALSLQPDNLAIQKRAIYLLLVSNNRDTLDKTKSILNKALSTNPDDVELQLLKARVLLAEETSKSIKQAVNILQKITTQNPKISQAWALLGQLALTQGQPVKALDIILHGLAYQPNDKSLLLLKAQAEAAKSPGLAIPTLKALQELYPNDIDILVHLANTYLRANQSQKAVELLEAQLATCNSTSDRRKIEIALAVALHKNGDTADSQKIFESLYSSAPDDPTVLLAQVRLLKDDKLWEQLNQKVINWCQTYPQDTNTPITIARELIADKQDNAKKIAESILRRTLENNPDCTEAMTVLATLLHLRGHFAESVKLYQQILKYLPDNLIALNNLAWIMCEQLGKYQKALELAQRGLKKAAWYTDLIDTRGVIYYRLGQYHKAVQDLTKCVEMYPKNSPSLTASHLHLARALAALGENDKAIDNLHQALELNTKIGGLSPTEINEANHLLEKLVEQESHATVTN